MSDYPPYQWSVFLKRIKDAREDRNLSQDACAAALGFKDKTQYTKRERGQTQFELEEIDRLRELLGMPRPWPFVTVSDAIALQQRLREQQAGRSPSNLPLVGEYLDRVASQDPEVANEMRTIMMDSSSWLESAIESALEDLHSDALRIVARRVVVKSRLELARQDPEKYGHYLNDPWANIEIDGQKEFQLAPPAKPPKPEPGPVPSPAPIAPPRSLARRGAPRKKK